MASDKEKEPRNWKQSVLLYVHDLMCMLLVVMLLFLVVFRVILVTGDSMFTTLWDGDYLLLASELWQRKSHRKAGNCHGRADRGYRF